ncbi:zinc ribbon domain-containing protein [Okeania sp. SIO1I7]|uniref:zinc ribbon domain-containing protein n=1 Tax=Okeania sp. SIO1I7 TaxID=2607772 RepID=UPI0025FE6F3D|nr:zinc ribbon domain-containing protein [Okeania sp. SIO1I7]
MPLNVRTFDCPECGSSIDRDLNTSINLRDAVGQDPSMPVDGVLPTVPVVCVAFRRKAGSKHENITLCDVLYQFYEAEYKI